MAWTTISFISIMQNKKKSRETEKLLKNNTFGHYHFAEDMNSSIFDTSSYHIKQCYFMIHDFRKKIIPNNYILTLIFALLIFQGIANAQAQSSHKLSPISASQEMLNLCELFLYAIGSNDLDSLLSGYQVESLNDSLYLELYGKFELKGDFEIVYKREIANWKNRLEDDFNRYRNKVRGIEFKYDLKKEDVMCWNHSDCNQFHGSEYDELLVDRSRIVKVHGDDRTFSFDLEMEVHDSPKFGLFIRDSEFKVKRKALFKQITSFDNREWRTQNSASELSFSFIEFDSIQLYIDGFTIVLNYKIEGTNMVFSYFGGPIDNLGIANESGDYIGKGYFVGDNLVLEFTGLKDISKNLSLQNKQYTLVRR
jgi:hypothetical protein